MWLKKYKKDKMFIMVKRRVSNLYVIQSRHANLKNSHAELKEKLKNQRKKETDRNTPRFSMAKGMCKITKRPS